MSDTSTDQSLDLQEYKIDDEYNIITKLEKVINKSINCIDLSKMSEEEKDNCNKKRKYILEKLIPLPTIIQIPK